MLRFRLAALLCDPSGAELKYCHRVSHRVVHRVLHGGSTPRALLHQFIIVLSFGFSFASSFPPRCSESFGPSRASSCGLSCCSSCASWYLPPPPRALCLIVLISPPPEGENRVNHS